MVRTTLSLILAVAPVHASAHRPYSVYNGGKSMPTNQGDWLCDCASGECMGQRSDTCSRKSNPGFVSFGEEKAFDVCRKVCDDHNQQRAWEDHECNAFAYCSDGCYFKHLDEAPSGHAESGDCTFYTVSQLPGVVEENDDCLGCQIEERKPDSELWKLFSSSGEAIQKQVEDKAAAMGWNGHFKQFVPVRYAVQVTNGKRFFIKVRVQSQLFIDVIVSVASSPSNAQPTVEGIAVGVDKKAPIKTDFNEEKDVLV